MLLKILRKVYHGLIELFKRNIIFPKAKRNPKWITDKMYKKLFKTPINYENPKNINEKIHWLKFYSDTTLWSALTDKIKVREYVAGKGFGMILNEIYKVYQKIDDINILDLPGSFVMKTNNGCGDILVVDDKKNFSNERIKIYFRKKIEEEHGVMLGEYHYRKINPLIFAEKLLLENNKKGLTDYKFYCYNGEVKYVTVIYERTEKGFTMCTYDMEWNHMKNVDIQSKYQILGKGIKKPASLNRMVEICKTLSEGIPFVRIDLYEINEIPVFGEMTFTPAGGFLKCYTPDFLEELGNPIICTTLAKNKYLTKE